MMYLGMDLFGFTEILECGSLCFCQCWEGFSIKNVFPHTVSSVNKVTQTFNIKGFDVSNKSEALFLFCFPIYFFSVVQGTLFHYVQFSISA